MNTVKKLVATLSIAILSIGSVALPSQASMPTLVTPGTIAIASDGAITLTESVFSTGGPSQRGVFACPNSVDSTSGSSAISFVSCLHISSSLVGPVLPTNIFSSNYYNGASWVTFDEATRSNFPHFVYYDQRQGSIFFRTASVLIGAPSEPASSNSASRPMEMDPGVSFTGPMIRSADGRTVGSGNVGVMTIQGKRLNQVVAATIGGIPALDLVASTKGGSLSVVFAGSQRAGKYTLVLILRDGSTVTLRDFVTVF